MVALLLPHAYINENSLSELKVSKSLYFIMSSITLVRHCCFYKNMVYNNSTVNVKQKQIYDECDPILKSE